MKHHTLITFLGRGRPNPKVPDSWEYARTKYQFPCPNEYTTDETASLGIALAEYIKPDLVVILGTRGSSWSVLLENLKGLNDEENDLIYALLENEMKQQINQKMLDKVAVLMQRALNGIPVVPLIIEYGADEKEQYGILSHIANIDNVPDGKVSLDLTHGFRHLGMIGFLSGFMLERVRKLEVRTLWYGALDMTPREGANRGITPVIKLDGLDRVRRWMSALERFEATGDYGVFAPLLTEDGVDPQTTRHLEKAAFHERTSNLFSAAREIEQFQRKLQSVTLGGASRLFKKNLNEALAWIKESTFAKKQGKVARQYLTRRDYVRAAIFSWEALITKQCEDLGRDAKKREDRVQADEELKDFYYVKHGPNNEEYKTLNQIRNALTHGSPPEKQKCKEMLGKEDKMISELENVFNCLKV